MTLRCNLLFVLSSMWWRMWWRMNDRWTKVQLSDPFRAWHQGCGNTYRPQELRLHTLVAQQNDTKLKRCTGHVQDLLTNWKISVQLWMLSGYPSRGLYMRPNIGYGICADFSRIPKIPCRTQHLQFYELCEQRPHHRQHYRYCIPAIREWMLDV